MNIHRDVFRIHIIVDGGCKLNQDAGIGRDMFMVRWALSYGLAKQDNYVSE